MTPWEWIKSNFPNFDIDSFKISKFSIFTLENFALLNMSFAILNEFLEKSIAVMVASGKHWTISFKTAPVPHPASKIFEISKPFMDG